MFFFDPMYLVFALPGLLLSLWASYKTRSTFKKYSQVPSTSGLTGAEAAQRMLMQSGVDDVTIEETSGFLSDHYDPTSKTLRLSPDVFGNASLSAIGVACHEAGHAIQHQVGYAWLNLRSSLVPVTNISSSVSYFIILLGFLFTSQRMILLGILLFSIAVVFSLITLPVEWDASKRAKNRMEVTGVVHHGEASAAAKVLDAAFLTYVAAAVSSVLTLLYYLFRSGIFGGGDD